MLQTIGDLTAWDEPPTTFILMPNRPRLIGSAAGYFCAKIYEGNIVLGSTDKQMICNRVEASGNLVALSHQWNF